MAFSHVDLDLTGGSNDGTTWAAAYEGGAGLVTALGVASAGDTIYMKDTLSEAVQRVLTSDTALAASFNPVRVIGVKAATTNEGASIVQSDLIPGLRTGDATPAYAQTAGNAPPSLTISGGTADMFLRGGTYYYGSILASDDDMVFGGSYSGHVVHTLDECQLSVSGVADFIQFGASSKTRIKLINSKIDATAGNTLLLGPVILDCFNSIISGTDAGVFTGSAFSGVAKFVNCDLSGCSASGIFDIAGFTNGRAELHNCKMPASHVLITGTAAGIYTVINYGSEDSTGLTSGGSEQALQIYTNEGTVDIETTVVRTGGATDLADGLFAYAAVANNVSDNFVGVEVPLLDIWVEGDGTSKTYTAFIANDTVSTDFQDDEVKLRLSFPSEVGVSMYDYLPDEGAPSDGGGQTQLLGTPANLTDDTGSTWGTGGNNHQKLSQAIAPDYEGVVHGTLIYSRSGSDTLYVDPLPTIA